MLVWELGTWKNRRWPCSDSYNNWRQTSRDGHFFKISDTSSWHADNEKSWL